MMTTSLRRSAWTGLMCLAVGIVVAAAGGQRDAKEKDADPKRPKLTLKAQPTVSISPARVVFTAELVGGPNDYEEFYCPETEWDWGDGTKSESSLDCRPFEAGKSEIKRRFTVEHRFRRPGNIQVSFRLKRNDKAIATASVTVLVQPGFTGND